MTVAGDCDGVLVVVPPDPVDRLVLVPLRVVCHDHTGLLGIWTRGPGEAGPVDEVSRLLVREEQRALEPVIGPAAARKFEQKRWKFALLGITYFPWSTPALCWFRIRWLTIALV